MSTERIVFSGSGGQGLITAAIILAEAAVLHEGLNAVQTQVYGPEARGGATRADVIISDSPIHYPKVTHPHVLVCLTQEAYASFSGILWPGGLLLTDSHFVKKRLRVDARQVELAMFQAVTEKIRKAIVFNICMLGALVGLTHPVRAASILKVLESKISPEFLDMNKKAFDMGLQMGQGYR